MNKELYFSYLKQELESEALRKNLKPGTSINMDWGELQLILSIASNGISGQRRPEVSVCYLCGSSTELTCPEQYTTIQDNQIKHKCLDCLKAHVHNNKIESELLFGYWQFVKDKELEDEFEYFLHEQQSTVK